MCTGGLCGICKYVFFICAFIYGFFHITLEMVQTLIPVGLIIVGFLSIGLYCIRIPAPDLELVESVVGKHLTDESEQPTDYFMRVVGHRGAGLDVPENTIAAFAYCDKNGCTAVEFDISLTLDNVPIIFHDNSLERVADSTLNVSETNWIDLSKIDISVKHPFKERYSGVNIPTLDEALQHFLKSGQRMFFDIKTNNGKMINIILDLFEKYPDLCSRAVVSSFYPNLIYYIRRSNPRIVCALIWRPHCFAYTSYSALGGRGERRSENYVKHLLLSFADSLHEWFLPRITYDLLGVSIVCLHKDVISPKVILEWKNKGVRVVSWTVNLPVEKQYFARTLKIPYMTDTLTGENSTHNFTS